jgi:hypothetical protein
MIERRIPHGQKAGSTATMHTPRRGFLRQAGTFLAATALVFIGRPSILAADARLSCLEHMEWCGLFCTGSCEGQPAEICDDGQGHCTMECCGNGAVPVSCTCV